MWRGGLTARKARVLIDHLPPDSAYTEAVANDEEAAEQYLARHDRNSRPEPPPLSQWTPTVETLAKAVDRLGEVINAVVASGGGKPKKIRPLPRPVTAIDRVRQRNRVVRHRHVLDLVEQARTRAATQQHALTMAGPTDPAHKSERG